MQTPRTSASDKSFIPTHLLGLAPLVLPNHRSLRYLGDDLYVRLDQLALRDQELLQGLYQRLSELLYAIADTSTTDAQKWEVIQGWIERHNLDEIIDDVREVGFATHERNSGERLAKAMHDVRGGALSSLLGRLQLLDRSPRESENLNVLFVQARDHLKIMRNAVVGLDEPRRNADCQPKAHAMRLMLDKWHLSVVGPKWHERSVRMEIDCRYEGPLTECCLESAAIDRIFYNLAANACRHAADERLEMMVFPVPDPPSDCLRFVLSNRVGETDAARLRLMSQTDNADSAHLGLGQSLFPLFEPEVSSTGSGFGLKVVADFVASAFGLRHYTEALHKRYVGAILDGQMFRAWFHWPVTHAALVQKTDNYHQPRQSLSEP